MPLAWEMESEKSGGAIFYVYTRTYIYTCTRTQNRSIGPSSFFGTFRDLIFFPQNVDKSSYHIERYRGISGRSIRDFALNLSRACEFVFAFIIACNLFTEGQAFDQGMRNCGKHVIVSRH